MLIGKLNQKTLIFLNFFIGGIVFSVLPTGFASLWVLGMQDNSASEEDIFRLMLFSTIIFTIGGIIGSLVTYLRFGEKKSAVVGGTIISIIVIGFFLLQTEKPTAPMIFVLLFYVLPGITAGLISGFIAGKLRKLEVS